jgi:Cupin-like domain
MSSTASPGNNDTIRSSIVDPLEVLADTVSSLWVSSETWQIPVLDQPPTPLHFLREFVALSRPCIIRNAFLSSPNAPLLNDLCNVIHGDGGGGNQVPVVEDDDNDFCSSINTTSSQLKLTVAVTPDGHGDCIRNVATIGLAFVEPAEEVMTLQALAMRLAESSKPAVAADQAATRVFSVCSEKGRNGDDGCLQECSYSNNVDANNNGSTTDSVYYYSRQNDCLRAELPLQVWQQLRLPDSFPWAEAAFGTGPPDAVNLWMGNQQAVTSMHKDHYENLFCVVSGGEKVFTLCPPSDIAFLYERPFPRGQFRRNSSISSVNDDASAWTVRMHDQKKGSLSSSAADDNTVQWLAADVTRRDDPMYRNQFPLLRHAHPVTVHVQAGEMLYLPALWFHRVTQTTTTVAVNYWYDMRFDSPQWCYFHYLQTQAAAAAAASSLAAI